MSGLGPGENRQGIIVRGDFRVMKVYHGRMDGYNAGAWAVGDRFPTQVPFGCPVTDGSRWDLEIYLIPLRRDPAGNTFGYCRTSPPGKSPGVRPGVARGIQGLGLSPRGCLVCAPREIVRVIVRGVAGDESIPRESVDGYNVGGLGQWATGSPSRLPLVFRGSLGSGDISYPFEEGSCGKSHWGLQG